MCVCIRVVRDFVAKTVVVRKRARKIQLPLIFILYFLSYL